MTDCTLIRSKSGHLALHGPVDFDNMIDLYHLGCKHIGLCDAKAVQICLAGLAQSGSVCLALLLAWLRHAREYKKQVCYRNVPDFLTGLAKGSDVDKILFSAQLNDNNEKDKQE